MTSEKIEEVAETVYEMMTGDPPLYDPSVLEIVRRHTGKNPDDVNLSFWRDALTDVRDELAGMTLTQNAHIVSEHYYNEFRDQQPHTVEEAKQCVCAFQKAEGIRLPQAGTGDLVYTATLLHNAKCGTSKAQKSVKKGMSAANNRELSTPQLKTIITEGAALIRNYYEAASELERRGHSLTPLFSGDGMPRLEGNVA